MWAGSFLELLDYASVGLAALTGLTVASVIPLRRRADLPHPYRMPLYPLPPIAFLILTVATIGYALADETSRVPGLLSLATLLIGIPLSRLIPQRAEGGRLAGGRAEVNRSAAGTVRLVSRFRGAGARLRRFVVV